MGAASAVAAPPPASREVRIRRSVLTVLALAGLFGALYLKTLPCMFARVTHHPCPGCGSTRACLALFHGDLADVFHYNPFGPAVALIVAIFGVQAFVSMMRYGDFRGAGEGRLGRVLKVAVVCVGTLEVALWIVRFFGFFGGPVPV